MNTYKNAKGQFCSKTEYERLNAIASQKTELQKQEEEINLAIETRANEIAVAVNCEVKKIAIGIITAMCEKLNLKFEMKDLEVEKPVELKIDPVIRYQGRVVLWYI